MHLLQYLFIFVNVSW